MKQKELKDISWLVDEPAYRADPALSYSTLAKYEREGRFNAIPTLFDRVETPSLLYGSIIDCYMTDGEEAFNNTYMVADFPSIPSTIENIVKQLFAEFKDTYNSLKDIPYEPFISCVNSLNYQPNWKPETRVKVVKEKGQEYYDLLFLAKGKTIISNDLYIQTMRTVDELKHSPATAWYFSEDNPFDNVKRYYQLKFKATLQGVEYRNMMDLVVCDYDNKKLYPCDLKTSSHKEWEFPISFLQWRYDIQAKLYFRIFVENIKNDPYFKDFTIENYRFIVINKETLTPLVWEYEYTKDTEHSMFMPRREYLEYRSPLDIGRELRNYLDIDAKVPNDISIYEPNKIMEWLNRHE